MKQHSPRFWLRVGAVGSALVFGCSQAPPPCKPGLAAPATAWLPAESPQTAAPSPPRRPEVRVLEVVPERAAAAPPAATSVSVSAYHEPPAGSGDEAGRDAAIPYGHAPDYRWLTGELRYAQVRQAWCLRYAGEDDDDRHGGSVTLVTPGPVAGLRPGQAVRVEGELLDPESRDPSPPYRARTITPLPRR